MHMTGTCTALHVHHFANFFMVCDTLISAQHCPKSMLFPIVKITMKLLTGVAVFPSSRGLQRQILQPWGPEQPHLSFRRQPNRAISETPRRLP